MGRRQIGTPVHQVHNPPAEYPPSSQSAIMTPMASSAAHIVVSDSDAQFQDNQLQRVSRTFALTIPQLPTPLDTIVGNAYLFCRIADTIEDCPTLTVAEKQTYCAQFVRVVDGGEAPEAFAEALAPRLAGEAWADERELIVNTPRVIRIFNAFGEAQQTPIRRCVRIMAEGMEQFQKGQFTQGLRDQAHLDAYCYHVAGVVGETLTALFCAHSPAVATNRNQLERLSVTFGQGLQMTNILKDVWDDKSRGVCWLPREPFAAHGFDLETQALEFGQTAFREAFAEQIGIAFGHLENALRYTLLIPPSESGIRLFCLWSLGMAVLTLRKIHQSSEFQQGASVKISRGTVRSTVLLTKCFVRNDFALTQLFKLASRGLPRTEGAQPKASAIAAD